MKFKFEGSEAEFRALFGARTDATDTTDGNINGVPAAAAAPTISPEEIDSPVYKIGDTVRMIPPGDFSFEGDDGFDYTKTFAKFDGIVQVTGIYDGQYELEGELLVPDLFIAGPAKARKAKKAKAAKVTQASSLQESKAGQATGAPRVKPGNRKGMPKPAASGRQKAPAITPADIKAKVDFSKYTTIPELIKAITAAGFKASHLARLLEVDPASISTAVRNNHVYPYLSRAITQHLQFPPPVPATERELHGLDNKTLAKAREIGS